MRRCRSRRWHSGRTSPVPSMRKWDQGHQEQREFGELRRGWRLKWWRRDEVRRAWRTCGFMLSRTSAGVSSWWLIPGFCRIERKIDKCGVASCCGGQGWGLRRSGLNGLRAAEGVAGIPHECVPGLFRVFSAFMAIYARFPAFSGGSPSGCSPFAIP